MKDFGGGVTLTLPRLGVTLTFGELRVTPLPTLKIFDVEGLPSLFES